MSNMGAIPTQRADDGRDGRFAFRQNEQRLVLSPDEWPEASRSGRGALSGPHTRHKQSAAEEYRESSLRLLVDLRNAASDIQRDPKLRLNSDVLAAVSEHATTFKARIKDYSPYHAILGVTSLAMIGYRDEDLFRRIHNRVKAGADTLSGSSIADLVWSCGALMIHEPALLETLKKSALRKERVARMTDLDNPRNVIPFKERALLAWGFAAACPENNRQSYVKQIAHPQDLNREGAHFNHWHLMYQALVIAGLVDSKDSFPQLQSSDQQQDERAPNSFETSVLNSAMTLLGEHRYPYYVREQLGGVETDLMIVTPHGNVVIEADGEAFHRLIGPDGGMLRGKDQAQDRFLTKFGVKGVIHVGSWEWNPLHGEEILRHKINEVAPFLLDRP